MHEDIESGRLGLAIKGQSMFPRIDDNQPFWRARDVREQLGIAFLPLKDERDPAKLAGQFLWMRRELPPVQRQAKLNLLV